MPDIIYRTKDNQRVPRVSTINKIGQETGGLIHWAWSLGMDGIDYWQVRDNAAEGGTVGHALVEAAVKGVQPNLIAFSEEAIEAGTRAFSAYQEWREQSRLTVVKSEIALVSEKHRYGGKLDAIVKNNNSALALADWKSGGLYPEHLCQMAAYGELWNENASADEQITAGYHLCRFNRDTGDFTHSYFADLADAFDAFLLKRQLYDLLAKLKKRV